MDIISACEAEGYDFVTKSDTIYVFEDELNYVFVDTTEECIANGLDNYISVLDCDVSTISKGYMTMTYHIDSDTASGNYIKAERITTKDKVDNALTGFFFSHNIIVDEEGFTKGEFVKKDSRSGETRITAKPGDTVSIRVDLPDYFREASDDDIVFNKRIGPEGRIYPELLEIQRERIFVVHDMTKIDDYRFREFAETMTEEDLKSFIEYDKERIDSICKFYSDGHIFVYNKESGNVSYHNMTSVMTENDERFIGEEYAYEANIGALVDLPKICRKESERESAQKIVKHLDDLRLGVNEINATGQLFDAFKSSIVKKISYDEIEDGMVIAQNTGGVFDNAIYVFEVTHIEDLSKSGKAKDTSYNISCKPGYRFIVNGELDNFSNLEAKEMKNTNVSVNAYYVTYGDHDLYVLDEKAMEAASLLDHIIDVKYKVLDLHTDPKLKNVVKTVKNEIREDKDITTFWKV